MLLRYCFSVSEILWSKVRWSRPILGLYIENFAVIWQAMSAVLRGKKWILQIPALSCPPRRILTDLPRCRHGGNPMIPLLLDAVTALCMLLLGVQCTFRALYTMVRHSAVPGSPGIMLWYPESSVINDTKQRHAGASQHSTSSQRPLIL